MSFFRDEDIDATTQLIEMGVKGDVYTPGVFRDRLDRLIDSGKRDFLLDLSNWTFADAAVGVSNSGMQVYRYAPNADFMPVHNHVGHVPDDGQAPVIERCTTLHVGDPIAELRPGSSRRSACRDAADRSMLRPRQCSSWGQRPL